MEVECIARRVNCLGREEKGLLVWLVKTHTGVADASVSERLRTGHPTSAGKAVIRVVESARLLRKVRGLAGEVVC